MKISNKINNYLKSLNIDYLPYKYSLIEKINISKHIKEIINANYENKDTKNIANNKVVKSLKKNGFYKYESNYFSPIKISNIIDHLKAGTAYPSHIAYYDKHHPIKNPFKSKLPILSFSADQLMNSEELLDIVLSKELIDICSEYLGAPPVLFDLNAVITNGKNWKHHETHNLHRDHDDFHHVLFMLYLTDVDDDTGPHTYLEKSHLTNNLSSKLKPKIYQNNMVKDEFIDQDKFKKIKMTGKAGTGFLTDANGLHSGQSPKPGKQRVIIWARYGLGKNYMWNVHNHHWWNYDKELLSKYNYGRALELFKSKKNKNTNLLNDPPMRCTTFYNWNIVVWGKIYYAIPQKLGPFNIEDYVKINSQVDDVEKIMSNFGVITNTNYEKILKKLQLINNSPFKKIKKILNDAILKFTSN